MGREGQISLEHEKKTHELPQFDILQSFHLDLVFFWRPHDICCNRGRTPARQQTPKSIIAAIKHVELKRWRIENVRLYPLLEVTSGSIENHCVSDV
mmetsp:Transcript_11122/g.26729  ORF Transcript_11122/g.26729 Transcript_11122/m.26729 type:complete len:96 (-) Transcript_11122:252-539(-)